MSRATRVKGGAKRDDLKLSRRQETFKATSERAQQAHQRAHQCFLSMIEGPVEPQEFIAKARYINPEVYADVVVERAVAGLCGYPMCSNIFTDTYGSRTYIIRSNVLYDISERRNFCSSVCYEASLLVQKQVLTLPLYLRDTQDADIKDVHLPFLSKLKGQHGKLVDITGGISKIELEKDEKPRNKKMGFKSIDDIARESLVNWSENEADLSKEQVKSSESNDANQNNRTTEGSYSNQNRNTAEESSREQVRSANEVKKNNDKDKSRTTKESNDMNQNRTTTVNSGAGWSRTITEADSSPLASLSENLGYKVGLQKECVGVDEESDTQKEENLNKEDSGYESSKEARKKVEYKCDTIQKENLCDEDGSRSECVVQKEQLNKEEERDSNICEGVCDQDDCKHKNDRAEKKTQEGESREDLSREAVVTDVLAEVLEVEAVMRQWVSFDSLRVVLGDLYVRGMLEHLSHSWDNIDNTSGLRLTVEAKARYVAICRRLEHEERQEELEGEELEGEDQDTLNIHLGKQNRPSKPLPDYSQLQRQAKKQQLKVVSFLGGSDQYEELIEEEEKLNTIPEEEGEGTKPIGRRKPKIKKQSEEAHTRDPTLPFVDSYSQVAWRQNIVIEKVTAYLQQLLEIMWLSVHEVKKLLGPLVATFQLSPNNISFLPRQWRLITLILLKMLSVRYPTIKDALGTDEGLNMQRTVLSSFSLDLGYCDRMISYLTQIQHVLSKDFKDETLVMPENSSSTQNTKVPQKTHPIEGNAKTERMEDVKATNTAKHLTQTITEETVKVKKC